MLTPFDYHPHTRFIFGVGSLSQLGELTREYGGSRALVVSDVGIVRAGHTSRAISYLQAAGITSRVFSDVHENPSTADVAACVAAAREFRADFLIGLGGGSSLDTAKGCNFILTNGGRMQDYWGHEKATQPMLPFIAIPTTSGTGSEGQSYALISDEITHAKMACGDSKAAAKVAILDPQLTVSQPFKVTAVTGIDAIAHALETAVCKSRNSVSGLFSREAFKLLHQGFERVLEQPDDLEARGQMQLGAAYAGVAIENSMLGAAHSTANPLTANHGIIHGQAVGVMLPHIIRFNSEAPEIAAIYADYYKGDLPARITELLTRAGLATTLQALNVSGEEDHAKLLASQAATQWTARFNPREVSEADFLKLYQAA